MSRSVHYARLVEFRPDPPTHTPDCDNIIDALVEVGEGAWRIVHRCLCGAQWRSEAWHPGEPGSFRAVARTMTE